MGVKTANLQEMIDRGINVHHFKEIQIENEFQACIALKECAMKYGAFTARGDTPSLAYNLPFLVINRDFFYRQTEVESFVRECINRGCSMLVSDGKKYDDIQVANVVVSLESESIKIEVSGEPVPLRWMYRHPQHITTYCGDVSQKVKDFTRMGAKSVLNHTDLERILNDIYRIKRPGESQFELTVYPQQVGIQKKDIIYWQIV